MSENNFESIFQRMLNEDVEKSGVALDGFKAGGRATKEYPNKENYDWWMKHGPEMVTRWEEWRDSTGWQFLEVAPGVPAIELGITARIADLPVKMFLDRVMVTPEGEPVIVDLKTGSRTPSSDLQLGIYATGMELALGIRPKWGTYWMARTGTTSGLVDLDHYSLDMVGEIIGGFHRAIMNGVFVPNFSHCQMCSVVDYCRYKNPNHKEV